VVGEPDFRTEGLDHVAITVRDLDHSEGFYRDVLGLERIHRKWDPPRVMASEGSGLALFPATPDSTEEAGTASPEIRIIHIAFRVDRPSFDAAQAALDGHGIEWRFSDHDLSHSIYFHDPDGHELELTTYEV
jgi:catechol 2,3-dioxygenase-like lactoylglutathione lyase family enzyme